jgi:hypothetical protein
MIRDQTQLDTGDETQEQMVARGIAGRFDASRLG